MVNVKLINARDLAGDSPGTPDVPCPPLIKNKFLFGDDILNTREIHRQHLIQCVDYLKNFSEKNEIKDFDKAAEDLRLATRHLGMIVGKVDVEEILGSIFNDFCIGK